MQNKTMRSMPTDASRPVIFLGTNINLHLQAEIAEANGMKVAGIIDDNYFGNTDSICDVPVIDTERSFSDPEKLKYYKENFNFFCAVTGIPTQDTTSVKNYQKRLVMLDLLDQLDLPCVSIISKHASISPSATIGRGVFVDHFVNVESKVILEDFVTIFSYTLIGHFTVVGRNAQFQRYAAVGSFCQVGENVHFSPMARAARSHLTFGKNTWIQHSISINRGTIENEVVSVHGPNTKRVSLQTNVVD
jgi:acetyltransferase-like isoleucine patch superfamily enzyme